MTLSTGTRIGVYEVVGLLGAGGMGEVYRAHDTRLGRDVAIKLLPASLAADPDRLARFEREARLLATLNHPNIAAIYGVEEGGGTMALVLELVEGETLAAALGRQAGVRAPGLRVPQALDIARQLIDALDAAHERGIVHRDLKPANIAITPDGVVKVLDFGLAKAGGGDAVDAVDEALTHSPTAIGPTMQGVLLGTAAYMSPEQARGKVVDKRTDIWAFGCVLFEMLAGRRAFDGDTVTDTLARILERGARLVGAAGGDAHRGPPSRHALPREGSQAPAARCRRYAYGARGGVRGDSRGAANCCTPCCWFHTRSLISL